MNKLLATAFNVTFWGKWCNKLFSLFVSVKILWTALFTILLLKSYIGEATFKVLMLAIVATRSAIEVYAIRKNGNNKDVGQAIAKAIAKHKSEEE